MIRVYGIKNCDSVKKALKFLDKNNLPYEFHDFKKEPASCSLVQKWAQSVEMKQLFNTRGTTYRTLKLKELNLDDAQKLAWLCKENMLIKRPVIEYAANKVLVAYDEDQYAQELL